MILEFEAPPFDRPQDAVRGILSLLQSHVPLTAWIVTRGLDTEWPVDYAVSRNGVFRKGQVLRKVARSAVSPGPSGLVLEHADGTPVPICMFVSIPLIDRDSKPLGTLLGLESEPRWVGLENARAMIESLARTIATLLDQGSRLETERMAARRLRREATTDPLTGVLNRKGWAEACEGVASRNSAHGTAGTIVAIDLDGLKQVNDCEGHAAGDAYLVRAVQAISSVLRQRDVLARLGGDEFAILVDLGHDRVADALVPRLRARLHDLRVSASIGCASWRSGESMEAAAQRADKRMYVEKSARRRASAVIPAMERTGR